MAFGSYPWLNGENGDSKLLFFPLQDKDASSVSNSSLMLCISPCADGGWVSGFSFAFSDKNEGCRIRRGCGRDINTATCSLSMGSSSSSSSDGTTCGRASVGARTEIGGGAGRGGLRSPPNMRVKNVTGRSEGIRYRGRRGLGAARNAVAESG